MMDGPGGGESLKGGMCDRTGKERGEGITRCVIIDGDGGGEGPGQQQKYNLFPSSPPPPSPRSDFMAIEREWERRRSPLTLLLLLHMPGKKKKGVHENFLVLSPASCMTPVRPSRPSSLFFVFIIRLDRNMQRTTFSSRCFSLLLSRYLLLSK